MASKVNQGEAEFTLRDWNDEERMNFMYSPFPKDRAINPRHWDSKMNYWIEEIKRCCSFYRDICINCKILRGRFSMADGRVPHGLSVVLYQMEKQGLLANKGSLLRSLLGDSWLGWTFSLVQGSAKWLWSMASVNNPPPEDEEYVIYDSLNVLGMEIVKRHFEVAKCDITDHVVPWKVAKSYVHSKPDIGDDQLMLVLSHLKSKGQVELASNSKGEKLIKFASTFDTAVDKITEIDWNILRLKRTIAKLKIQTIEDKKELSRIHSDAVSCLRQANKTQAKRLIYQKKKLEKSFNVKQDTLLRLIDQLTTIQNASSNRMILDAITSSTKILNASLHDEGLSPELVNAVFDESIEAYEYAKEIDSATTQGIEQLGDDSGMQDLEEELSKLLSVDELKEKPKAVDSFNLPYVPDSSPQKLQETKKMKNKILAYAE